MRALFTILFTLTFFLVISTQVFCTPLAPIATVSIDNKRAFQVNGKAFFPLMAWLQNKENFAALKRSGMNATAGYRANPKETEDVIKYLKHLQQAGLYGVMPFDTRLKRNPTLLGYIHADEPDLSTRMNDVNIEPANHLIINKNTPLWKIFDGNKRSWSVLDPLKGAYFTIKLDQPVTVNGFAISLTTSKGLSVAKEILFETDHRVVLKSKLISKSGRQLFQLPQATTFSELKITITDTHIGKNVWGSIAEIEGIDSDGHNVLLSRPRLTVRKTPFETMRSFQTIKSFDSSRPVFMTITGNFHPQFQKRRGLPLERYPDYIKSTDVIGYDIYPIFGWNKPEWLHFTHEATDMLVQISGQRPVFVWIETSRGGKSSILGPLSRQHQVSPQHIRAEVWMAICRGATAIGYFTHRWTPTYQQFGVPENNRQALREINDQITRLAADILANRPKYSVEINNDNNVKLDVMAKERSGILSIFSVNYDEELRSATASIHVPWLKVGSKITVVDESRSIIAKQGHFNDTFSALAVHIYKITIE
ncbi:MAG: hypothetical protein JKY87_02415 [Mariprofundus sp.]|nr:hypothetical protein [Mariprofundus sp.]